MGVIEKAGGSLHKIATKKQKKKKKNKEVIRQEAVCAQPKSFDLNFAELAKAGLYNPDAASTQLALELRAVKRRLLRRIGFLRAAGERQAFRAAGRQRNLILVTSTCAGEGKSFNAVNLALSLAFEDQIETLLVDADVPRPKVRALLGLPDGPGLTDKFMDSAIKTEALMHRATQAPLTVMGEGAPVERVSELFAGDASQRFWADLSNAAPDRLIIIDAPPVLAVTEAVILAKYVDEIVFVVGANSTPETAAASAIDELLDVNPNVSLLLNRCLIGSGGSHYGSYEYYGRDVRAEKMRGTNNAHR
jgi:protein-tyrosine kinase